MKILVRKTTAATKGIVGKSSLIFRGASALAWLDLASTLVKPVADNLIVGAGQLASSALNLMNNIAAPEMSTGRLPATFMNSASATERTRAISAMYNARISPSNRFMGNEAQMYHR